MNEKTLVERVQRLRIVEPEVVTGNHHVQPGRVRVAELVARESATVGRRKAARTQ
jgi:hypothetical protein